MAKVKLYSKSKTEDFALPKGFEAPNMPLLAQAVRVYEWNSHEGTSKTKTRGEVKISTRKIYRQKHTGNARHGAKSAPIFVGGGTAHGPKGIRRKLTLPKKMRALALKSAYAAKIESGKLVAVSGLSKIEKTKEAAAIVANIMRDFADLKSDRITLALARENQSSARAFANIKNVNVTFFPDLNAYSVYRGGIVVIDRDALDTKKPVKPEAKSDKTTAKKTVKSAKKPAKSKTSKK